MLLTIDELRSRDELLGPVASEAMLNEAHEALYVTAMNCHVERSKITSTLWVKRYLAAYTFWRTAILKSYSAAGSAYRSGDDLDAYAKKIAFYESEIKSLETKVTAQMLTGEESDTTGGFRAVRVYRG